MRKAKSLLINSNKKQQLIYYLSIFPIMKNGSIKHLILDIRVIIIPIFLYYVVLIYYIKSIHSILIINIKE